MTPRIGEPRIEARNDRYWVVHDAEGNLRGDARRSKDGDWTVTRTAWRGANGCGEIAGFPGGPHTVGHIPAGVSVALQKRLVKAMLAAIAAYAPTGAVNARSKMNT